jgi:hypothetical protein
VIDRHSDIRDPLVVIRGLSCVFVYGANRSGSAVPWLTWWPVTREALLIVGPQEADGGGYLPPVIGGPGRELGAVPDLS